MMELTQFILNSDLSNDAPASLLESVTPEKSMDTELTSEQMVADSNSFVLLMNQVLANVTAPVDTKEPVSTAMSEEVVLDPIELLDDADAGKVSDDEPVNPKADAKESILELDNNIAMIWLNSEGYTNPNTDLSSAEQESTKPLTADKILTSEYTATQKPMDLNATNKLSSKATLSQNTEQADTLTNTAEASDMEFFVPQGTTSDETPVDLPHLNLAAVNTALAAPISAKVKEFSLDNLAKMDAENLSSPADSVDSSRISVAIPQDTQTPAQVGATVKTVSIPVEVNHPQWKEQFAEHVVWLGQNKTTSALIKLHPEELGPIEINIKMVKDAASIVINSHSTHVCQLVEQSMPRLREMMVDQGLSLADVQVNADTNSQNDARQNNSEQGMATVTDDEALITPLAKKSVKGLIDYFA